MINSKTLAKMNEYIESYNETLFLASKIEEKSKRNNYFKTIHFLNKVNFNFFLKCRKKKKIRIITSENFEERIFELKKIERKIENFHFNGNGRISYLENFNLQEKEF